MGQAKRRKELGLMPEPSQKPRKTARIKVDSMYGMDGIGSMAMLLAGLMSGMSRSRILPKFVREDDYK